MSFEEFVVFLIFVCETTAYTGHAYNGLLLLCIEEDSI